MRPSTSLLLLALLPTPRTTAQNPASRVEHLVDHNVLAGHIRFLADDLLEGRGVASRGDALARLYLRTQFELLGLEPGGVDGTWEQPVTFTGINASVDEPLVAVGTGGERRRFTAPEDYVAFAGKPNETTGWTDAELVFVGYGITAPEQSWDDFKGFDCSGKVLLVMNNDPADQDDLFAGKTRLYYGRWSYKYEEAARRGAAGAIVIHTNTSAGYPFHVIQAGHEQERFHLPFGEEPELEVDSWCSEEAARALCKLGGHELDALRAQAERREFKPVPLGVRVSLKTRNTVRSLQSANVLGMLPGSDPTLRDQVVLVTAHFDHLGISRPEKGDAIYNGALDNASGTAAMLTLARACAALGDGERPRRSLLFAGLTGEESGLLGARHYARNPTVPRKQLVANLNIDGINVWGETRDLEMIGHGKSSWTALAEQVAARRGRVIEPDSEPDKGYFYRSDHFALAQIGVPAAYFKAGSDFLENPEGRKRVKASYLIFFYHRPADEFDARWKLGGAVADLRLMLECLLRVAQDDAAPRWTPGDEFEKLR